MKYVSVLATALLGLASTASAVPLEERAVQTVNLKFYAGPATYTMTIPADGQVHPTNHNDLNVNIIESSDYDIFRLCQFHYDPPASGTVTLVSSIAGNANQVFVGPPTPIKSVSCQGVCLTIYQDCYINGQFVAPCCNGYCAANKCRPWSPLY
ncbi:hypothetical protein QBC42DRAFT_337523 [Cladorrhinum samala]|uniref:Uncharacterized protein n=1 Tax=Cladorrhinum samala TaxID=585594 RepID=A0AAV9HRV5_9PEZI|nr:hypothetical protein QBC42DRAFT_337523 [Cladorrhinum samala]